MIKHISAPLAALVLTTTAAQADIQGVFQTEPNDGGNIGHVEFFDCGGLTCGKLVGSFNGSGQPIESPDIGKNIVWDMAAQSDTSWSKGRIWDPSVDKTYRSKMSLSGDTLKVSGCIGPICRSSTWTRVK